MVTTADPSAAPSQPAPPVSEAAPEVVRPESDRWAEFDGTVPTPETGIPAAPAAEPVAVAPEPSVAAAPEVPPAVDPRVQQELDALRQERQQWAEREAHVREQEDIAGFQTAVGQLAKELEETDGLTPERAQAIAQRQIGVAWQAYQADKVARTQIAGTNAKVLVAAHIAEQFKVPVTALLQYNTPGAMHAAAQHMTNQNAQAAEIVALRAQIAKLTKAAVPAQTFAQGVTVGSGATATPDNIDELYSKDPNRWEATYRRFLAAH